MEVLLKLWGWEEEASCNEKKYKESDCGSANKESQHTRTECDASPQGVGAYLKLKVEVFVDRDQGKAILA